MAEGYALQDLSARITLKFPEKEKAKLEFFTKKVPQLDKFYKAFSMGGAAVVGASAGLIAAAATMTFSSSGFKKVLGAMWDIIGLISDLIFLTLWPVIKPMIQALMGFARSLLSHKGGKGILGALEDPEVWARFGEFIGNAVIAVVATSNLMARVMKAFIYAIKPYIPELVRAFLELLWPILHTLGEMLYDLIVWAFAQLGKAFLEGIVRPLLEGLISVVNGITGAFSWFIDQLMGGFRWLIDQLTAVFRAGERFLGGQDNKGPLGAGILPGIHSWLDQYI